MTTVQTNDRATEQRTQVFMCGGAWMGLQQLLIFFIFIGI